MRYILNLEFLHINEGSQMVLVLKNLPAIPEAQKTWVQSLDQEDPLEEKMATHSSILA